MTADIAHDLRTPLTVITGYIEALRDGVLKPTPERFDAIHAEAQHLQHLVDDLRTLSLADAGELASSASRWTAGAAGAAGRRLCPPGRRRQSPWRWTPPPTCRRSPSTPSGWPRCWATWSATRCATPRPAGESSCRRGRGRGAVLAVTDTGEGDPRRALPHVFDRFYRADPGRSDQGGESGLGLAIARSIVEAHGGTIAAASTPGRGTTFTITLPSAGV